MRKIEWELRVDPMTFMPRCVCFVEGQNTDVGYSMEAVCDITAQYGKDQIILEMKTFLEQELIRNTDLTLEERVFALGEGFKMKPLTLEQSIDVVKGI